MTGPGLILNTSTNQYIGHAVPGSTNMLMLNNTSGGGSSGNSPPSTSSPSSSTSSNLSSSSSSPHNPVVSTNSSSSTTASSSTSSSSKQILNGSTIKMLQRVLDEASQTGDLLLCGKNLNEYPSKIAQAYDLSDTIYADLSKNHLIEFPRDLCQFDSLEKLTLQCNQIRLVALDLISPYQLSCLKVLDLNSNNLAYLPPCLCNLASLQVLTVNNNRLVSLPEEIGRLEKLIQLDVSCNEITHLPVQIGEMSSLRSLNVRRNLLVELPKEIAQLKLVSFDCSSNRLSKLPLCFREMITLIDLVVDHNPLELPPAHVCTKGLLHIMKYLLVESIKEEKKRGILNEYEINSSSSSSNLSYLNSHQRLSCTNSIQSSTLNHQSATTFGYMFQNSVKNMCKNLPPASSSSGSSSKTSSTSSSSTSLTYQQQAPNMKPQQVATQQQQHSPNYSDTKVDYGIMESQTNGNNLNPSSPSSSPSSSSSSTSSHSSNTSLLNYNKPPPPSSNNVIQTHKIQEAPNSKLVSIHELITTSSTTTSASSSTSTTTTKPCGNQTETILIENDEYDENKVWRMNENLRKKCDEVTNMFANCALNNSTLGRNYSINNGMNSNVAKHQASVPNLVPPSHHHGHRVHSPSQVPPSQPPLPPPPPPVYKATPHHMIYDESLNPVVMFGNNIEPPKHSSNPYAVGNLYNRTSRPSNGTTANVNRSSSQEHLNNNNKFNTSQQVWVPRDDFIMDEAREDTGADLMDPTAFTIKRHLLQIQEEQKQVELLKRIIEQKLKVQLPQVASVEELGVALADGVILCHLMNQIFPRSIQLIHVPSLSMPKLSLAKCRKNVENFIDACRRLGLQENDICCAHDIIEAKNTVKIARTCIMLVNYDQYMQIELDESSTRNGSTTLGAHHTLHHIHPNTNHHHHHHQQQQQYQTGQTQPTQQQTAV